MGRQSKEYKNFNCKMDKGIVESLEKFVEETGMTKTATAENAIKMYIEYYHKTGKIK